MPSASRSDVVTATGATSSGSAKPMPTSSPAPAAYTIVPAEISHVYALAKVLRPRDAKEIADVGISPKKALYRAFRNSVMCKTAFIGDDIAAMWGLCVGLRPGVSPLSDLGVPWLHTSGAVERIPVSFVKVAKAELALMRASRRRLESFVAADYPQAVKLLRVLGFTVERPEPIGVKGARFCRFHIGFDS
jgi:hypothetical protein